MARAKPPYRVEWRPKASEDLHAIIRYIGKDNPARAQSFGRTLRDKAALLERHPELGRSGRPGLPAATRELIAHPNYIILYHVLPEAHVVEILRIKHAAQHIP